MHKALCSNPSTAKKGKKKTSQENYLLDIITYKNIPMSHKGINGRKDYLLIATNYKMCSICIFGLKLNNLSQVWWCTPDPGTEEAEAGR
jgi:hypothetical protein